MDINLKVYDNKIVSGPINLGDIKKTTGFLPKEFISHFESIGDNCEFGLVQRHCGYEPIDEPFRFATSSLDFFLGNLENKFEGLEDIQNLSAQSWHPDSDNIQEYALHNTKLGWGRHSFVNNDEMTAEQLVQLESKRIRMQKKLFFERLKNSEKILVFKSNNEPDTDKIIKLHDMFNKYGEIRLLWVTHGRKGNIIVEKLRDNLCKGSLERFAPYERAFEISFDPWLAVCAGALQLLSPEFSGRPRAKIHVVDYAVGGVITSFPSLYELAARKPVSIFFDHPQMAELWAGPPVEILSEPEAECRRFDIQKAASIFHPSGLHMIQAWFWNFELQVPSEIPRISLAGSVVEPDQSLDVIISPYSASGLSISADDLRILPFDLWNIVIDALLGARLSVGVCGVFKEGASKRSFDRPFWGGRPVRVLDSLPLVELCAYLRGARCVVTVDNGICHLAHILGVPHAQLIPSGTPHPPSWIVNRNPCAAWINEPFRPLPGRNDVLQPERVLELIFAVLSSFNKAPYFANYPDLEKAIGDQPTSYAWGHWVRYGKDEGRDLGFVPKPIHLGSLWQK